MSTTAVVHFLSLFVVVHSPLHIYLVYFFIRVRVATNLSFCRHEPFILQARTRRKRASFHSIATLAKNEICLTYLGTFSPGGVRHPSQNLETLVEVQGRVDELAHGHQLGDCFRN